MSILVAAIVLSSVAPTIVVVDGKSCGAGASNVVVIEVLNGVERVEFSATVFSGTMDPTAFMLLGDASMTGGAKGKGRVRVELPGLHDLEKKLRTNGWVVFRSITIEVDKRLVASIGLDVERTGGQCIFVRL